MEHAINYEQDFYSWLMYNAQLLKEKRFSELDIENIAEELESMGRRDKRELLSRLTVLLAHLLKWQFQPVRRSKSWERTIDEQREQIYLILSDSPSLKYQLENEISHAYDLSVKAAAKETGMKKTIFPETCPFASEQILDENFYPDAVMVC
ncbi:MAG: hypothetical protein BWK80_15060 [Desulfobacteraceae bacterium IS3]|jgi:hypothetical protein|nr:MAG: hypothetical protein BWK80_15060 [Desulfobacteraceae bacterium IS3]HAO23171.1 DUF29 domain-containing protein [Desulfobacteraceae bacterium]